MWITDSLYLLMFSSGLLGGIGHCVGMCGPVVAAYTLGFRLPADNIRTLSLPQLLYNAGRITTYSIVGGVMGMTGSFAGVVTSIGRFQNMAMAAVGGVMVILGMASAGLVPLRVHDAGDRISRPVSGFISRLIQFISQTHTPGSVYVIGMATGFIPCGLLYTAYIAAAGAGASSGHPAEGFLKGMAMLLLFGAGTTPALFFIGHVAARKGEWIRRKLHAISSIMMTAVGIIFIYRAFWN